MSHSRLGGMIAILFLASCSYAPQFSVECEPGESSPGRECVDGVWVVADLDAAVPDDAPPGRADGSTVPDATTNAASPDIGPDAPCVPETNSELCLANALECGSASVQDRCGNLVEVDCGMCPQGEACSDANQCDCEPHDVMEFCEANQADCGTVTAMDNCGVTRTEDCGQCDAGISCGEEMDNVCGCPCLIDGECVPEGQHAPDDPCLVCDPDNNSAAWSIDEGNTCDDADRCTESDACTASGECTGTTKDCSGLDGACTVGVCDQGTGVCEATNKPDDTACTPDGLDCTADVCQTGVCRHPIMADACLINGTCRDMGDTDGPCQRCEPTQDQRNWTIAVGEVCTTDALDCTTQTCSATGSCDAMIDDGTCLVSGTCYMDGESGTDDCQTCQPAMSQTSLTASSGNSCTDSHACTESEMCNAGVCEFGSIQNNKCFIDGQCMPDGSAHPNGSLFCLACDADVDQTDWSVAPDTCFIDNTCFADGADHPSDPCLACDADADPDNWSPANESDPCMTTPCSCQSGVCAKPSGEVCQ